MMGYLKPGINDLQTKNPDLALEWDYDKNRPLKPSDVAAGSHKKVWWTCPKCGNSYVAQINSRNNGTACKKCSEKIRIKKYKDTVKKGGKNTLLVYSPNIAKEWDDEKNLPLTPSDVSPHTAKKVWWKCPTCGCSYYSKISGRVNEGKGCPICAGVEVRAGINDLETVNPSISQEWDYNKNSGLLPTEVTANSTRKVYWKCSICGGSWKASIADRNAGTGCKHCAKMFHASFPEEAIFYYVKQFFPDAINSYRPDWLTFGEIDIFIPSLSIGLEYDSYHWHRSKTGSDNTKGMAILNHRIHLIRIRESGLPFLNDGSHIIETDIIDKKYLFLQEAIIKIFEYVNKEYKLLKLPIVKMGSTP